MEYLLSGNADLLVVISLASLIAYAIFDMIKTRNLYQTLSNFVTNVTSDQELQKELISRYNLLSEQQQKYVNNIVDVLAPFTDTLPTDLDRDVLNWLKKIIEEAEKGNTPNG